jgi:hypothetical protein
MQSKSLGILGRESAFGSGKFLGVLPPALRDDGDASAPSLSMPGTPGSRWVLLPEEAKEEKKDSASGRVPPLLKSLNGELPMALRRATLAASRPGLSLVSSNGVEQRYDLRVTAITTLISSAAGVLAEVWPADPSVFPYGDWSSFSSLFDEVKFAHMKVHLWVYDPIAVATGQPAGVSGSFLRTTAAPSSLQSVATAGNSQLVSMVNTSPTSHVVSLSGGSLGWAATSSPNPGPFAGCPGSCQLYASGLTPSVSVGTYMVVAHYHLRGRL